MNCLGVSHLFCHCVCGLTVAEWWPCWRWWSALGFWGGQTTELGGTGCGWRRGNRECKGHLNPNGPEGDKWKQGSIHNIILHQMTLHQLLGLTHFFNSNVGVETYMSKQRGACQILVILSVGVDEDSRGSLGCSVIDLKKTTDKKKKKKNWNRRKEVEMSSPWDQEIGARWHREHESSSYHLCKTDLSTSQQQHTVFELHILLLQIIQILLTAIVAVHQFALCTHTSQKNSNWSRKIQVKTH